LPDEAILILTHLPDRASAHSLARSLVEEHFDARAITRRLLERLL
jgi:uncharacterized protein involved in tolerance to divalent cations